MVEYSADRAVNKKIIGADWGQPVDKYAPKIAVQPKAKMLEIGFMPTGRLKVGADWGPVPALSPRYESAPQRELPPINLDALTPKVATTSPTKDIPRKPAYGLEVELPKASVAALGVLYVDVAFKATDLPPVTVNGHIPDIAIEVGGTKPGLSGNDEKMVLVRGDLRDIVDYVQKFEIRGKSVAVKNEGEIDFLTQPEANARLKALRAA